MSKIESLPGIQWSPAAALADVMESVDDIEEIIILYTRKSDEYQCSRSANLLRKDALWMLEIEKQRVLDSDY